MVSLYLSNYDGTAESDANDGFPDSNLRFGDYNTTGIVKDQKMYFWPVTS